jgi:uncharacterized protein (TIGR03437 family)
MSFPAGLILYWDLADFNGDVKRDVVATVAGSRVKQDSYYVYQGPYSVSVAFGKGDGTFAPPVVVRQGDFPSTPDVIASDFTGDGYADFLCPLGDRTEIFQGKGDGTFTRVAVSASAYPYEHFAMTVAADMDADGKSDLVQAISASNIVLLFLSVGDGTLAPVQVFPTGDSREDIAVVDLNGDGWLDFVAVNRLSNEATIALNTSRGIRVSRVVNAASFGQGVAPGSLVSLFGAGLARRVASAQVIPLPRQLGGVSVAFDGIAAPLLFVSPTQINAQIPWAAGPSPSVSVTWNGVSSSPFTFTAVASAPGVFSTAGGIAVAVNLDGSLASAPGSIPGMASHPAAVGDTFILYATGLGAVAPAIADGAASSNAVRRAQVMPTVLIGGVHAPVSFAGLSLQFVGVNQLNVVVPTLPTGVFPVQIESAGVRSTEHTVIYVQGL